MCLNIGTPNPTTFLFGTNRKVVGLGVPIHVPTGKHFYLGYIDTEEQHPKRLFKPKLNSLFDYCWHYIYRISSVIRQSFFLPKQTQRYRSILQDGSRSLGLFRKGKIGIIAKFHRTDLVI